MLRSRGRGEPVCSDAPPEASIGAVPKEGTVNHGPANPLRNRDGVGRCRARCARFGAGGNSAARSACRPSQGQGRNRRDEGQGRHRCAGLKGYCDFERTREPGPITGRRRSRRTRRASRQSQPGRSGASLTRARRGEGDPLATALPPPPALLDLPLEVVPAPSDPPKQGTLDELVEQAQGASKPKPAAGANKGANRTVPAAISGPGSLTAPAEDANVLPPATEPPGQPAAAPSPAATAQDDKAVFTLPAEQLPMGRQSLGLTVDVIAPQVLNINQTATLKVVVKNSGSSDAKGVVVRDRLPDVLEFLSSQPEAQRIDALLSWHLGTVPAGSERVITLSVKPTKVGDFDHAATVTMLAGGKSRTRVREPKLKVEQTATSGKILKGQPVQFKIMVSNPGDGPVKNVTVQAKLSAGLRHESGEPNDQNLFEQTIDLINPGERVTLDTLVADTLVGGEQSCLVAVQSPDVVNASPDARNLQTVSVVEPKLAVKIIGPTDRYTDTRAAYELTLENPGTAPAKNVRLMVVLPLTGRLTQVPPPAKYDPQTRKLSWVRAQLDPGEKVILSFEVLMKNVGIYTVAAQAQADGITLEKDMFQTNVEGLADVTIDVTEKRKVIDVNGETVFTIKVTNAGSKPATGLIIKAVHSNNLEPIQTSNGSDVKDEARWNQVDTLIFPQIPRLEHGKSIELQVKVKATKPGGGFATCRVYLEHDDFKEKIDDVAIVKITPTRR